MTNELILLLMTAVSLAIIHTLAGPDHYLPFIVISKARNWSYAKTCWFTALCGLGHVGSSVVLGFAGIAFGIGLSKLVFIEGVRGSIVSFLFTAFGLVYLVWAVYRMIRSRPHNHFHFHHDGTAHLHEHSHQSDHLHVHEEKSRINLTPWILFTIFVFGPCEPLIPIVMYPAAKRHYMDLLVLTTVFSTITILTMLTVITISFYGIKLVPMRFLQRYAHVLAGGTIFLCGMGMLFLGL